MRLIQKTAIELNLQGEVIEEKEGGELSGADAAGRKFKLLVSGPGWESVVKAVQPVFRRLESAHQLSMVDKPAIVFDGVRLALHDIKPKNPTGAFGITATDITETKIELLKNLMESRPVRVTFTAVEEE